MTVPYKKWITSCPELVEGLSTAKLFRIKTIFDYEISYALRVIVYLLREYKFEWLTRSSAQASFAPNEYQRHFARDQ